MDDHGEDEALELDQQNVEAPSRAACHEGYWILGVCIQLEY